MHQTFLQDKKLAIILPVYNESKCLAEHLQALHKALEADGITAHYHLVDDGSSDDTWGVIEQVRHELPRVSAIRFSRNFGKEIALKAGIDSMDADLYITMDSDLQHPPRYIAPMLKRMAETGADIVEGVKRTRGKESAAHRFFAKSFYGVFTSLTDIEMDNHTDFKLMNRAVILALRQFPENSLFFRGIVHLAGFSCETLPFDVDERVGDVSRFSFMRLLKLGMGTILSHTAKPLYITLVTGILFFIFAIILGIQTLYNFFSGHAITGFSTVILLLLIIGALVMISLGIIGAYIARIYTEVKRRPVYIIRDQIGD